MGFRLVRNAAPLDANAQLGDAGGWGRALQGINSARFAPVTPPALPPGWYAGNVPASGDLIPVPLALLGNRASATQMTIQPIGPVDQTTAEGNALQQALAATLKALQLRQGA